MEKNNWEKEFDSKFNWSLEPEGYPTTDTPRREKIKDFIRSNFVSKEELKQAILELREKEEHLIRPVRDTLDTILKLL